MTGVQTCALPISYQYTSNGTETVDTVYVYAKSYTTADTLLVGLYTTTDTIPNSRVWMDTVYIDATGWYAIACNVSLTNGSTYTLAIAAVANGAPRVYIDTLTMSESIDITGAMPTTWTSNNFYYYIWGIYATYTTSGTSTTSKIIRYRNVRLKGVK